MSVLFLENECQEADFCEKRYILENSPFSGGLCSHIYSKKCRKGNGQNRDPHASPYRRQKRQKVHFFSKINVTLETPSKWR